MSKFNVGDTVVLNAGINSAYLKHGVEYVVRAVQTYKVWVCGVDHDYDLDVFKRVCASGELTDKEVFNAIVDGKPLQYTNNNGSTWHDLKYPEKLTVCDIQRCTYRERPTEVHIDCTVPYPIYKREVTRAFSVDFTNGRITEFFTVVLPDKGVFWNTKEEAEKFRDAVLASLKA